MIFFRKNDKQNRGTIPMPTFARRPSSVSPSIPAEFLQDFYVWTADTANIGNAIRHIV